MEIKAAYDKRVDALYIRFKEPQGLVAAQPLSHPIAEYIPLELEDFAFDFDEAGKLVGIEVLSASQYFEAAFLAAFQRREKEAKPLSR